MILLQILLIFGFLLLRTMVILMGFIVIPMSLLFNWTTTAKSFTHPILDIKVLKYKWLMPWNNLEDGIVAGEEFLDKPEWFRILYWSCFRNPANGLRFIPGLNLIIEPSKIKYYMYNGHTKKFYTHKNNASRSELYDSEEGNYYLYTPGASRFLVYYSSIGLKANFRIEFKIFGKYYRLWAGYKIYPSDVYGLPSNDYRALGAGFATQFKKLRNQ